MLHLDWSADNKFIKGDNSKFDVFTIEVVSGKIVPAANVCPISVVLYSCVII